MSLAKALVASPCAQVSPIRVVLISASLRWRSARPRCFGRTKRRASTVPRRTESNVRGSALSDSKAVAEQRQGDGKTAATHLATAAAAVALARSPRGPANFQTLGAAFSAPLQAAPKRAQQQLQLTSSSRIPCRGQASQHRERCLELRCTSKHWLTARWCAPLYGSGALEIVSFKRSVE